MAARGCHFCFHYPGILNPKHPVSRNPPEIHGHRGARGLYPENSLPGIREAIALGCDAVEVDVCVSRDNQLMVMHDLELSPDFVRDANGHWLEPGIRVRELTAEQLEDFDIGTLRPGSPYAARFSDQAALEKVRIPRLDEYIETVMAATGVTLNI